ncbi:MAG TPA: hypothetical protein VFJ66_07145, partial [Gaiellales bacterium]|nr:hypothetical protein [Gaiellales bacterium]
TTIISLALVSAFAAAAVAGLLSLCFGQRAVVALGLALVPAYSASLVLTTIAVWVVAMVATDGPDSQEGPGAAALAFLVAYIVLPAAWALLVRHHANRRLRLKEA